jgi:trigger factor
LKIETTPRDDHQVRIVAEFDPEFMEKFKHQAARKISQSARIPGFRPGKAPFDVVRRTYGEDAIEKEAIEIMLDEVYPQVLKEAAIEPSGVGNLEEIISQNPPKFAFVVPLKPKVVLGEYTGIRQEYITPTVDASQVDQVIKNLRANYSTAEPVERPVQEGDLVSVKVSGLLVNPAEGEDAEAIKENTVQMIVGENEYEVDDWPFEGFSRELIGLSANDVKSLTHTFADDYDDEKLHGKEVAVTATVVSIKALNMPAITDEFAQTLGDYASVEALRTSIQKNLQENEQREYDNAYFSDLVDQIVKITEIKYPPQMMQEEIERVLHSLQHDLEDRKMDLPTYLKTLGKDQATFVTEDITPVATRRLERSLILDEIARVENVKLNTEELQLETARAMQMYQNDPEVRKLKGQKAQNFIENLTMETANRMLNRAVMDRLKAIATGQGDLVSEPAVDEAPLLELASEPAAEETQVELPGEPAAEEAPKVEPVEETPAEDKPAEA